MESRGKLILSKLKSLDERPKPKSFFIQDETKPTNDEPRPTMIELSVNYDEPRPMEVSSRSSSPAPSLTELKVSFILLTIANSKNP